ncbi:Uncharacterized protein PCOAH_00048830 [Plasmodium coatneyi]|uniref:Uncharacterized protein n=1 Tax=Plasmodium coatneyi TaxID=208452 RepID=A0A1B1E7L4_9APIC|nr:Uncharacterized protein PCOAH_00048830 [Plasmodium coatneyi]ANQ10749.1 Uncharacterized protein PCOAH_00048830 [Plasmodium coatneyi]
MYTGTKMHRDIKDDIIKSLPFTFSKVELAACDERGQKGETKQTNNNDGAAHVVEGNQEYHTDEGGDTDGKSPPEGNDRPNCHECVGGKTEKDNKRKRKEDSKSSRFNDQVKNEHVPNRQKKNSAKKAAAKPRKEHHLYAHTRGRDTTSKVKELLSTNGLQDMEGVEEGGDHEDLHYYTDEFNERAYVTVEESKVKNWRVQNYLNVDRLSLSVSTSSMGGKTAGEQDRLSSGGVDSSSDEDNPAGRVSQQGNNIFGESLFSSFNLNFDPLEGVSNHLGEHLREDFPTEVSFDAGVRDGPSRMDTDQTVGNHPLEVDNTMHSLEEDKELHLFDSLKNLYTNHNKKIKLINYSKILNTSLCKRMQGVVEGQQGKVRETSKGRLSRNGRLGSSGKKGLRSRGEPALGQKMTEHNVKAIIMNIKKRLGFYSGEERQETQMQTRHQKRREKPTFCDSLNYSRDELLSDSVTNELCNGEEPNSFAKVDAASQSAEKRIQNRDSQNLLNYKSFVSEDFNFSNDKDGDDLLGLSVSHNSQGESLPSSSEGCVSTDNEDVFALSTSSAQFKRSFLRAIGRVSNGVDNEGNDGETGPNDHTHAEFDNPTKGPPCGNTETKKQEEVNCQEVLKREEFPTGTETNCCGNIPSSGESPTKEPTLDGEGDRHSKNVFYINEENKKDKVKELTSRIEKCDEDVETCPGGSPKDFSTEGQQHSTTCNGNNPQWGEENESNKIGKTEGVDVLSQEMNAYMLDIFEKQVKHLNELVANVLS